MVIHGGFPLVRVVCLTTTHAALRILYADVQTADLGPAYFVVTGFLLGVSGLRQVIRYRCRCLLRTFIYWR
jgi:hypothetical protein